MAAYLIAEIEIEDPEGYEEYKRMAAETVHAFDGRYVVRGGAVEVLEGKPSPGRLVVLEFPSMARAKEWWTSEAYRKAREIRARTAVSRMILAEGTRP